MNRSGIFLVVLGVAAVCLVWLQGCSMQYRAGTGHPVPKPTYRQWLATLSDEELLAECARPTRGGSLAGSRASESGRPQATRTRSYSHSRPTDRAERSTPG